MSPAKIILMYHRVTEPECDPWDLCVSPQHFAEHLEILRRADRMATLRELLESHKRKSKRRRLIALTFDDGYADNLVVARPLLDRHGIPASVFLTVGALGSRREFWWDELERIFLQTENLPEVLSVSIAGEMRRWELQNVASYNEEARRVHRSWKAGSTPPTIRQELYHSIWALLRPLPHAEQRHVLDQLLAWADLESASRHSHRSLTVPEAIELSRGELIEIGAHTMTHAELSSQPLSMQEHEIRQSKIDLEQLLNREVTQFAYPYGDYSHVTMTAVRDVGFELACSTAERKVPAGVQRYELPRFHVRNWSGETFERKLAAMFQRE
jgi:peptidoglycan/xylan/chitin deacetylase (PgdA/CDA1 family)